MNELLYEETIEMKNPKFKKTLYHILTGVIIFDIVIIIFSFWVDLIMTALFVGLLILAIICKNRIYYSVDITFVEGSSRFARVINNSKRKGLLRFEASSIDCVGSINSDFFANLYNSKKMKIVYATPNRNLSDAYYVLLNLDGEKKLVVLDCSVGYINCLKRYLGSRIYRED